MWWGVGGNQGGAKKFADFAKNLANFLKKFGTNSGEARLC
jgi:hypothetical protein